MLRAVAAPVKPKPLSARGFGDGDRKRSDWSLPALYRYAVPDSLLVLLLAIAAVAAALALRRRRPNPHERAVREVLDAADALEARLRTARAEIEAIAGDRGEDPVGEAMREMLRQRLWLRDHGRDASLAQLAEVRTSIDAARGRIEQQLIRIERARAPMA